MIPGNQNEPAFTTSREGTFPGNDTIEPQTRASSEETTKALVETLGLTKLRDAAAICIRMYTVNAYVRVMRVRTHMYTRDCQNEFATLGI